MHRTLTFCLFISALFVLSQGASRFHTREIDHFELLKSSSVSLSSNSRLRDANTQPMELSFSAYGKDFVFDLELNTDLISADSRITIYGDNGEVISSYVPTLSSYVGSIRGDSESTISLTVLDAAKGVMKGMFNHEGELYQIDPIVEHLDIMPHYARSSVLEEADSSDADMIIFKASAVHSDPETPTNCGVIDPETGANYTVPVLSATAGKRSVSPSLPLPAYNCPTTKKKLVLGVATDASYATKVSGMGYDIATFIQSQVASISQIYVKTANVAIQLGNTAIYTTSGTPSFNTGCGTIDSKLNSFSQWRGTQSSGEGLWHLMTACYQSGTVGLAWINVLCRTTSSSYSGQYVSGTGVSSYYGGASSYRVPTHEMGHNFGCEHTSDGVMIAANIVEDVFQSSSQQVICNNVARATCITAAGTDTTTATPSTTRTTAASTTRASTTATPSTTRTTAASSTTRTTAASSTTRSTTSSVTPSTTTSAGGWSSFIGSSSSWSQSSGVYSARSTSGSAGLTLVGSSENVNSAESTWRAQVKLTYSSGHAGLAIAVNPSTSTYWAVTISRGGVYAWRGIGSNRQMYQLSNRPFYTNTYYTMTVRITQQNVLGITVGNYNIGYFQFTNQNFAGGVGYFARLTNASFRYSQLAASTTSGTVDSAITAINVDEVADDSTSDEIADATQVVVVAETTEIQNENEASSASKASVAVIASVAMMCLAYVVA